MQGAAIRKQDASGRGIKVVALRAGESIGEWEVRKETVTFGRSVTADVALQDNKKLSRIHCSFELRADGVWVRDAGSANGVWLHDRRVTEALLSPGDHVVAAGIRLSAMALEAPVADAPAIVEEKTPADEEVAREPTLRLLPAFDPSSVVVSAPETVRAPVAVARERAKDPWADMAENLPNAVEPLPPAIAAALIMPFTPPVKPQPVATAIAAPVDVEIAAPVAAVSVPVAAPAPVVVLSSAPGPFVDELADQIANLPIRVSSDVALSAPFALTIGGRRHARGVRGPRTMLWIAVSAVTLVVGGATLAALLT